MLRASKLIKALGAGAAALWLLACPAAALAAIGTPVNLGGANSGTTTVTSLAITTGGASAAGNAIVVITSTGTSATLLGVTDSASNTYTTPAKLGGGSSAGIAWVSYCLNCTALGSGGTITASWSTAARAVMVAASVSGIVSTGALDVDAAGPSSSSATTLSQTSAALAQASEIVFGHTETAGDPGTWTEASGFTTLPQQGSTSSNLINWSYRIVSSTSAVTYAPSWVTSRASQTYLYSFKGSAAAPSGPAAGSLSLLGVGR